MQWKKNYLPQSGGYRTEETKAYTSTKQQIAKSDEEMKKIQW